MLITVQSGILWLTAMLPEVAYHAVLLGYEVDPEAEEEKQGDDQKDPIDIHGAPPRAGSTSAVPCTRR